jgi:2-polyprenyl-3-methyl-5-hydroxy-6-metoxy-1,4-benzoquinol methylase
MTALLKSLLAPVTNLEAIRPLQMWYRRNYVLKRTHRRYANMNVADVFSEIYAKKEWSEDPETNEFSSGSGSGVEYTRRYCECISDFIASNRTKAVVDLGCGDFRVGRQIARPEISYTGVDLVPNLIEHNQKMFGTSHIRFQVGDLTNGELPDGDLCLIRQVLQHLSNHEIVTALEKCEKYRYVIITEHIPNGRKVKPNHDKPHGPDIRLYWNSGVFLEEPPFSQRTTTLLDVPVDRWSVLRTSLIEHPALFGSL